MRESAQLSAGIKLLMPSDVGNVQLGHGATSDTYARTPSPTSIPLRLVLPAFWRL